MVMAAKRGVHDYRRLILADTEVK